MLKANRISKRYGERTILDEVTFIVNPSDRIGLVGPNGTGKSTLLRILAGLEHQDSGTVSAGNHDSIQYLPQHLSGHLSETIGDYMVPAELLRAERRLRQLELDMSNDLSDEALEQLLREYGRLQEEFEGKGGYEITARVSEVLNGLGLEVDPNRTLSQLSGGQKAKVALAKVLVASPNILLLDEPTNHLDLRALLWLEQFVKRFQGAILVVSHDRRFLDQTVTRILELDEHTHAIKEYAGNYTAYHEEKMVEIQKQYERYEDYQDEVRRINDSIRRHKEWSQKGQAGPRKTDNEKLDHGQAKDRGAGKAGSGQKALEKKLERLEVQEKPWEPMAIFTDLKPSERSGNLVVSVKDAVKSFGDHRVLNGVDLDITYGQRIALLGPNGVGKTTLIKAILGELSLDSGEVRIGSRVKPGYFAQEQEDLDFNLTVLQDFLRGSQMPNQEARNLLSRALFRGEDVFKRVSSLSPGERARLVLVKLMAKKPNLLVFDEPTNHLDIESTTRVEETIAAFPGTILLISHDRYLLDKVGITDLWFMEEGRITQLHEGFATYERSLLPGE